MEQDNSEAHEMPLDGTLDLHTFDPKDVKELIPDFIEACLEKEIYHVRIIHGKGKGVLRQIVHSVLENHPAVASFRHESGSGGSWGATVVDLRKQVG
ncbi:MAG: DNA mismatch repair protein MutS [candidate division Zixibacteria bacterium HGW-Zixibacteria-1]|nr:MAG: DNA mismatch repair protein MutS [candidate division Zixibacteria bacterium HGW-Zixibacteria-1]